MSRIRCLIPSLTAAFLMAGGSETAPVLADTSPVADAPRVERARTGSTPRGARRLVVETSEKIDYLVTELPDANGFDVALLGTSPGNAPTEMLIRDDRVDRVSFRFEATGTVARIEGFAGRPLLTKSFRLDNPPRVVIDVYPKAPEVAEPVGPSDLVTTAIDLSSGEIVEEEPSLATGPKLVRKPYRTIQPERSGPIEVADGDRATPAETDAAMGKASPDTAPPDPSAVVAMAIAVAETTFEGDRMGSDFDELILWIHALKTRVDGLRVARDEATRAALRRELAYLLAERGMLAEAERSLSVCLESPEHDPATAFSDSLALAEFRVALGRIEEASGIARSVDASDRLPAEHFRLARILLDCGLTAPAIVLLDASIPALPEPDRSHARLRLAQARWDQGQRDDALRIAQRLTSAPGTPADVLASALILEADCLWAANRLEKAESLYRRAAGLALSDEEASWTGLQLGNLARRAGRSEEARKHYETTRENWPETFFGAQADWFLRIEDEIGRLHDGDRMGRRG